MGDTPSQQLPVDPVAGQAELEAVLSSPGFVRAPTLSKILTYVCKRHMEGAGDTITEWSIAVDALGRRQNFEPEKDSIVRVEFHFLRKRLAEYYQNDGASHPLRISFGDSGYVPRFISTAPPKPAPSEAPPGPEARTGSPAGVGASPESGPRSRRPAWRRFAIPSAVAIMVVAVVGAVGMWNAPRNHAAAGAPANGSSGMIVPPGGLTTDDAIRIAAGVSGPRIVDSSGHVWLGDVYSTGGMAFDRTDRKIFRTLDPDLYEKGREGEFRYDLPVKPGVYELRLHFAETRFGQTPREGAESMRRFDVALNGKPILEDFDITRDAAGTNTATVKIWKDVTPAADGAVHLNFYGRYGRPLLNAIELLPGTPGRPLPVRIVCAMHPVYDRLGRFWQADAYFLGGRLGERVSVYDGSDDLALYASTRYGNFNYAIPVVAGETYWARLRFADHASRGPGDRVFDVFCNGLLLLSNFDIVKRAGGNNRTTQVTFHDLKPNAQSKLTFTFVPSHDYASVHAIEVEAEQN